MIKILKHKREIIISLITGIFIFYIQPFLEYLGNQFVKTFLLISDKFSNNYYQSISKNNATLFSEWNSFLLNYFFSIICIVFIVYMLDKRKKNQSNVDETIISIRETKGKIEEINSEKKDIAVKTKEELLSAIIELEKKANSLRDKVNKRDNKIIFISIITGFLIVLLFSNHAINTSISKQNLIFRNDLIKIAPYTNDSVIIKLKSDWARIENFKNFNAVKMNVETLKKNYKIK